MKNQPKELFFQSLSLITLALSVVSFTTLYWQIIYRAFPDPLQTYYSSSEVIQGMMAMIIIAWPVYLILHHFIRKDLRSNPEAKESKIRRWFSYITLFFAIITLLIDLIVILKAFLGGELTVHFALRLLVVLATAGAVFAYTMWDMKNTLKTRIPIIASIFVSFVMLSAIVLGFMEIGTPADQRKERLDNERVNELINIKYNALNYYSTNTTLPESIDELSQTPGDILDPETTLPYTYRTESPTTFELCASFSTDSNNENFVRPISKPYGFTNEIDFSHTEGENCFTITIDPTDFTPKPL